MPTPDLVDRLAAHRALAGVPRDQLAWLASRGRLQAMAEGDIVVREKDEIPELWVILSGQLVIRVGRGAQARKVKEWFAGEVTGFLPYSRMDTSPGNLSVEEAAEVFLVHREHFPAMIRECHELTASLVHEMVDRAKYFTSSALQDERILSVGRLAAGLAHELNNPASAVVRSAEELARRLPESLTAFRALGAAQLPAAQLAAIDQAADVCVATVETLVRSPMEQSDREDAFAEWLSDHEADASAAHALAESALALETLDELAATLHEDALDATLRALAAGCATRKLASEIEKAATRIHGLVRAVKGFTYMDQATSPKPVDVVRGLTDTLTMLQAKARKRSVRMTLTVPADRPLIEGFGGELNQVWVNLIDNAIDAAPEGGHVEVIAEVEGDVLVVRVIDDGPGIPESVRHRVFEPFFTTKPVGSGTGLGLDIARRLVGRHEGEIELSTKPGHTEFCVRLPITAPASGSAHAPTESTG
jgi:signal transduction histidine kinase